MSCIQGYDVRDLFSIPVNLHPFAIHYVLLLILVDHVSEIRISDEVDIDETIARQKILVFLAELLHVVIVNSYEIFISDVFIDKKITGNLPDDLKIHPPGIVPVRLRINDPLSK